MQTHPHKDKFHLLTTHLYKVVASHLLHSFYRYMGIATLALQAE